MLEPKRQGEFEIKALIYTHRILLVIFLATLILVGAAEGYRRIHDAIPATKGPQVKAKLHKAKPPLDKQASDGVSSIQH